MGSALCREKGMYLQALSFDYYPELITIGLVLAQTDW